MSAKKKLIDIVSSFLDSLIRFQECRRCQSSRKESIAGYVILAFLFVKLKLLTLWLNQLKKINRCYVLANLNDEKERLEEELLNAEYLN